MNHGPATLPQQTSRIRHATAVIVKSVLLYGLVRGCFKKIQKKN